MRKNQVYSFSGSKKTGLDPLHHAQNLVVQGAGEIFLNSIDRDGEMNGFDLELIQSVARSIDVPLICCGGAGSYDDLRAALNVGASAVAVGSMFVFKGNTSCVDQLQLGFMSLFMRVKQNTIDYSLSMLHLGAWRHSGLYV